MDLYGLHSSAFSMEGLIIIILIKLLEWQSITYYLKIEWNNNSI